MSRQDPQTTGLCSTCSQPEERRCSRTLHNTAPQTRRCRSYALFKYRSFFIRFRLHIRPTNYRNSEIQLNAECWEKKKKNKEDWARQQVINLSNTPCSQTPASGAEQKQERVSRVWTLTQITNTKLGYLSFMVHRWPAEWRAMLLNRKMQIKIKTSQHSSEWREWICFCLANVSGKKETQKLPETVRLQTHIPVFLMMRPWSIFCPIPWTTKTTCVVWGGLSSGEASST